MATLSTSQYRDGVLGSTLEEDAAGNLDPALDHLIAALQPDGLQSRALPPAAFASAATAVALAQQARAESDIGNKIVLAVAASYAATFFGLPRTDLAYVIDEVCGMFAMPTSQRRDYHRQAARVLDQFVASLKKGNSMSGVFQQGATRGGSLGAVMYQNHAVRDGSLGVAQPRDFRDGSLGMFQPRDYRDGSLGLIQNGSFRDGSLGLIQKRRRSQYMNLRGLGGGCGCSGMGTDVVVAETPFYKKPLYIGGAAIALGVVLYAVTRK